MYRWIVSRLVRRTFGELSRGRVEPVLRLFAADARFVFPGRSSWALDTRDPAAIEAWFRRFAGLEPRVEVEEVLVRGWPWRTRVAVRLTDRITRPGVPEYTNHIAQFLRLSWGKVREDLLYLDTEVVAEFDAQLSASAG